MVAKYSTTKNRGIQTHTGNGSLLKLNSVNAVKLENLASEDIVRPFLFA